MVFYLEWAPNTYVWWCFNLLSIILLSTAACAFIASAKRISENERLLFWYMAGVNLARGIYTIFCTHAISIEQKDWVRPATHVFVVLVIVTFFLFLIYLARQKE